MRVALVCPYDLAVPGGVQNHILEWASTLRALGHEAHVLAPGAGAPHGLPIRWNGSVARIAWGPHVARCVHRWLAAVNPHVVHVHEPTAPSVAWHALRWSHRRWPTVATFHQSGTSARALVLARRSLGRALSELDTTICVSSTALRAAAPLGLRQPVVIPNGVDVRRWREQAAGRRQRAVAFVGRRNDPRKGFDLFAQATSRLAPEHPTVQWWALGPGGPVPEPVTEPEGPGPVPPTRLRERVGQASVVVAPNLHGESFGLVLVEALAAGARVVAADLPAFRDVLPAPGRGVAFHRAGDGEALQEQLAQMLAASDSESDRRARQEHAETFSWDRIAGAILQQYRRARV